MQSSPLKNTDPFLIKTPEKKSLKRPSYYSDDENTSQNSSKTVKTRRVLFEQTTPTHLNIGETNTSNDVEMAPNSIAPSQEFFSADELSSIQQIQYHIADECFINLRACSNTEEALFRINNFLAKNRFSIGMQTHEINSNIIIKTQDNLFIYKKSLLENILNANATVKQIASAQLSDSIILTQLFSISHCNILFDNNLLNNLNAAHGFIKFKNLIETSKSNSHVLQIPDELSCMNLYPNDQTFNPIDMNIYLSFLRENHDY